MREVCSAARAQITMVFYQIATKVDSVYAVELPLAVKQLLNAFSVSFSFGISYTSTPLECLGLHGYRITLLFWMILPLVLVLISSSLAFSPLLQPLAFAARCAAPLLGTPHEDVR